MGYSVIGELYGAGHRKSEAFSQTLKTYPAIYVRRIGHVYRRRNRRKRT